MFHQTVKTNKETCEITAERCRNLLSVVTEFVTSVDVQTANERFKINAAEMKK